MIAVAVTGCQSRLGSRRRACLAGACGWPSRPGRSGPGPGPSAGGWPGPGGSRSELSSVCHGPSPGPRAPARGPGGHCDNRDLTEYDRAAVTVII